MFDVVGGDDPIRVLLVDDHQMFADTIVQRLSLEPDLEVVGTAVDVRGAGRAAVLCSPDVVLLDLVLPDGEPAENVRALLDAAPDARVIVLTGRADPQAMRSCIAAGCHGFLTKDRTSQELIDAVRAVAGGESVMVPSSRTEDRRGDQFAPELSPREREVLALLADGQAADAISRTLGISRNTARAHIQRVLDKLGARSQLEAVALARRAGWV